MVGLTESPEQLQVLLDIIQQWSDDWGLEVGVGQGKTNVMHVSTTNACSNATLRLGDAIIGWTDTYRYLGYNLDRQLANNGYWQTLVDRISHVAQQYVTGNSVVRHLSVASQIQVFNTHVLGSFTYLLPIIPLSDSRDADRMDGAMRKALRKILGAHQSCSNASVYADTRAVPIEALVLQHRLRFQLEMTRTPARESPAVQVYSALVMHASSQNVARDRRFLGSWLSLTASLFERFCADVGVPVPAPPEARSLTLSMLRACGHTR
jgi:hypothetical protein